MSVYEYAVLDGGKIVRRKKYDISKWPATKRNAIDQKGDGGPVYRPVEYVGSGNVETVTIEASRVIVTRSASESINPTPLAEIPIKDMINAERDRRIYAGFAFAGNVYQSDERSMRRISDSSKEALGAIINGAQANNFRWHGEDTDFTFITSDNNAISMDAPTMFALGLAAGRHERFLIDKARALKDRPGGPPEDYAKDSYWT